MSQVPTIKIKIGEDIVVINESDFDPSIHKLVDGEVLSDAHRVTVQLTTELSPELQKLIDNAKIEIAKVSGENEVLQIKIKGLEVERDALAAKLTALEAKETVIVIDEITAADANKIAGITAKPAKAKTKE